MTAPTLTFTLGSPGRPASLNRVLSSKPRVVRRRDPVRQPTDPQARSLVTSIMRLAIEALSGRRPLAQLQACMNASSALTLKAWLHQIDWRTVRLASVRTQCPSDDVIEGSARMVAGDRSVAATVRLECRRGRWSCTHVGLVGPWGMD